MHVEREVFESSLRSARSVLELLGHPPHEARQHAMRFRQHNIALFERMYPHHKDRTKLIARGQARPPTVGRADGAGARAACQAHAGGVGYRLTVRSLFFVDAAPQCGSR